MIRFLPLLLALPLATATADVVRLKSGEVLEGKITQSDADGITIQVPVSPTIIDERTIARSDIARLAVESSDESAYAKIRDLKSPGTLLNTQAARTLLDTKLIPFLKEFPSSPRVPEVRARIRAVEADIARLKAGDLKVSGTWYDKATFIAEKYQIEAATVLEAMRQQIKAKNYPAAINSFDFLQRTYQDSGADAEAVPLAIEALRVLRQQLAQAIANLPQIKAQRQAAIDRTPIEEQPPVKQAIAAEDARAAASIAMAQKNNRRFYPLLPFDEKGLTAMQSAATQTAAQLDKIDQKQLAQNIRLLRQAREELDARELTGAQASLEQLKLVWPRYEALPRMEAQLRAAAAANAAAKASLDAAKAAKQKPD